MFFKGPKLDSSEDKKDLNKYFLSFIIITYYFLHSESSFSAIFIIFFANILA